MSATSLVHPLHYLIVQRRGTTWYFKSGGSVFYNPRNVPVSLELEDILHRFSLTMGAIAIELFRLRGGKAGYYLVNLRAKHYYFCGAEWDDVKRTLQAVGIGRSNPMGEE